MVDKPLPVGSEGAFTAEGEGPGDAAFSASQAAALTWSQVTPPRDAPSPPALAGAAEQANATLRAYVAQGHRRILVALDDATTRGLDSDAPEALGEVAVAGVAIDSLADMTALFDGVSLEAVCPSFAVDAPAIVLLAFYVALADERAIPREQLHGAVRNDVISPFIVGSPWLVPPAASLRLARDVVSFCARALPHWQAASLRGYVVREAGATPAQELAFALASALSYVETCASAGLSVDDAAARISFLFDVREDFFEEIAKLRAARQLCARLLRERLGVRDLQALAPAMHVQTSALSLTVHQPENNTARVTLQTLAAILGGASSVHTSSLEELYALPTERSAREGLRVQQLIDEESGASRFSDPLRGSALIEGLTERIERDALAILDALDARGGLLLAIEQGWPQREVRAAAIALQRRIERAEHVIVGVNRHVCADEAPRPPAPIQLDEPAQRKLRARAVARRAARDGGLVSASLGAVREAARRPDENLVEPIILAAKAQCTLQEICDALRAACADADVSDPRMPPSTLM